jgi:predicted permease
MANIAFIFVNILLPIFFMVALGGIVHRAFQLDLKTLVRINMNLFVPSFLFSRLIASQLTWAEIGRSGLALTLPLLLIGVAVLLIMRAAGASPTTVSAAMVASVFFNAGNFGIPFSELAFGEEGGRIQAVVMMFLNTVVFWGAYSVLAIGQGTGFRGALQFFKLPYTYVVIAALVLRGWNLALPGWLDYALNRLGGAVVPTALIILGAQLVENATWPKWRLVLPVMLLKLLVVPAATAVAVVMFDLWPMPGAALIMASAAPTAINSLVLTLEVDGDAETAAACVFWTTLGSAITVAVILSLVKAKMAI